MPLIWSPISRQSITCKWNPQNFGPKWIWIPHKKVFAWCNSMKSSSNLHFLFQYSLHPITSSNSLTFRHGLKSEVVKNFLYRLWRFSLGPSGPLAPSSSLRWWNHTWILAFNFALKSLNFPCQFMPRHAYILALFYSFWLSFLGQMAWFNTVLRGHQVTHPSDPPDSILPLPGWLKSVQVWRNIHKIGFLWKQ